MTCKKVIAFLGKAGSGKNYQCSKLIKCGYRKLSFADPLRKLACKVIGLDFDKAMEQYDELKKTKLINDYTFRNILEQLGEGVRDIEPNFWVKAVIDEIRGSIKDICIDDVRYPNEYIELHDYCQEHGLEFHAYLCDYHSDRYDANNPHSSAQLANYLVDVLHKQDMEEIDYGTIAEYSSADILKKLKDTLKEKMEIFRNGTRNRG